MRIILILLLLCFFWPLYGQNGKVCYVKVQDVEGAGVSNAHLIIESDTLRRIFVSDEDGVFTLAGLASDKNYYCFISHLAFEKQVVKIEELYSEKTIQLLKKSNLLQEVAVNDEVKEVSVGTKRTFFPDFSCGMLDGSLLLYIPANGLSGAKVKKVEFRLSNGSSGRDTIGEKLPLELQVFSVDSSGTLPGESLLNKTIWVVKAKDSRQIVVDVSNQGISMPSTGIFVGVRAFGLSWYIDNGYLQEGNLFRKENRGYYQVTMEMCKPRQEAGFRTIEKSYTNSKEWRDLSDMMNLYLRLHCTM